MIEFVELSIPGGRLIEVYSSFLESLRTWDLDIKQTAHHHVLGGYAKA
jgi:hypothetical protein